MTSVRSSYVATSRRLLLDPGEFLMKSTTMKAVTVVVALLAAMTFAKSRSTTNSLENGQLLQAERAEHS